MKTHNIPSVLNKYEPRNFGKEYCKFTSSIQYPMFVATALGAKPVYDDWIFTEKYDAFVAACKKYDLHVEPDVVFLDPKKSKQGIAGGNNITTTYFEAKSFDTEKNNGKVHVFVSLNKKNAIDAKKNGWYPLIVGGRVINKPYVDHLRFGKLLGFPKCCIDFFQKYNNWHLYSNPFEIYKNTRKKSVVGSYYCNNFLMDNRYFLIHHLPCSYRCPQTIALAKKVESEIERVEPEFIIHTKKALQMPLLVFQERNFVWFDGILTRQGSEITIQYSDFHYFHNPSREEETITWTDKLKQGNTIKMDDRTVVISDDSTPIKNVPREQEWFAIDFE